MKTLLLPILFLTSFAVNSQTWCDPGANWKYSFFNFGSEGYTEIQYVGDTVINGQSAHILDKHLHAYNHWIGQSEVYDLGMEYTYENNGVVYLWYENNWDTLYNFNASVGESWRMAKQPHLNFCDSNSLLTVTAVGTKFINSISLNYLVLDFSVPFGFTFSDTIVEKIGFIGSYMLPYDMCDGALDVNEGGVFRCYEDDNFTTYKPHYSGQCDFVVGIEENVLNTTLKIVPNPASNQIEIIGELASNTQFVLVDSFGKNWTVNRTNGILDVSNLASGVYHLSIIQNASISHHKFVIR